MSSRRVDSCSWSFHILASVLTQEIIDIFLLLFGQMGTPVPLTLYTDTFCDHLSPSNPNVCDSISSIHFQSPTDCSALSLRPRLLSEYAQSRPASDQFISPLYPVLPAPYPSGPSVVSTFPEPLRFALTTHRCNLRRVGWRGIRFRCVPFGASFFFFKWEKRSSLGREVDLDSLGQDRDAGAVVTWMGHMRPSYLTAIKRGEVNVVFDTFVSAKDSPRCAYYCIARAQQRKPLR